MYPSTRFDSRVKPLTLRSGSVPPNGPRPQVRSEKGGRRTLLVGSRLGLPDVTVQTADLGPVVVP